MQKFQRLLPQNKLYLSYILSIIHILYSMEKPIGMKRTKYIRNQVKLTFMFVVIQASLLNA